STERVVHLDKPGGQLARRKFLLAECPGKKAAIIAALLKVDQERTLQRCFSENHRLLSPARGYTMLIEACAASSWSSAAARTDLPQNPSCQTHAPPSCDAIPPSPTPGCIAA